MSVDEMVGADHLALAPGKTGERGIWSGWEWYCSQECWDARRLA